MDIAPDNCQSLLGGFHANCRSYSDIESSYRACSGCSVLIMASALMVGVLIGILMDRFFIRFAFDWKKEPSCQKMRIGIAGINCKTTPDCIDGVNIGKGSDQIAKQKLAWRNQVCKQKQTPLAHDSSAARSMLSLRGALFANSMRKLNIISGRIHGLVEARGRVIPFHFLDVPHG
jgi:hypothetical protein